MKPGSTLFTLILLSTAAQAQSPASPLGVQVTPATTAFEVPSIINNKFGSQFPNTNAVWSMHGENYRAEFNEPGLAEKSRIEYDKFANLVSDDRPLTEEKTPATLKNFYYKRYPNHKLMARELNRQGVHTYYVPHEKDTLRFNGQGQFLQPNRAEQKAQPADKR